MTVREKKLFIYTYFVFEKILFVELQTNWLEIHQTICLQHHSETQTGKHVPCCIPNIYQKMYANLFSFILIKDRMVTHIFFGCGLL